MMFAVLLFCFTQIYAKSPISEVILNAKTAIVINDRATQKDFDKFNEALKEWGRFEFVQDRASADIIITLSADIKTRNIQIPNVGGGYGGVQSQPVLVNSIRILNAKDDTPLWSDETSVESNDPKHLIANLKNKMKKK
jgi:hypothetical protein